MARLADPHNVREFMQSLEPGTRVIWIANGARGTVLPDRAIQWDDGSRMSHKELTHSHALLIHNEAEWERMQESLSAMIKCLRCGYTVQRLDGSARKDAVPEKICPIAVLSDPEMPVRRPPRFSGKVRLGAPKLRGRARSLAQ